MLRLDRYCLYTWLRIVNVVLNMFGAGMIVYCLWLLKEWNEGVAQLPSHFCLPRPWFVYVCLGGGIVVCLITLSGHMVANCLTTPALSIQIIKCIGEFHNKFKSFLIFHLVMCRLIAILVLVAQVNIVVLATILWALGVDATIYTNINSVPVNIRRSSFLLDRDSSVVLNSPRSLEEILRSYMQGVYSRSSYLINTFRN